MALKAFSHNVQPLSLTFRHCCHQTRHLRTQPRDTFSQYNNSDSEKSYYPGNARIATPREVFLASMFIFCITQKFSSFNTLINILSARRMRRRSSPWRMWLLLIRFTYIHLCRVFNHYNRVRVNLGYPDPDEYGPVDIDAGTWVACGCDNPLLD